MAVPVYQNQNNFPVIVNTEGGGTLSVAKNDYVKGGFFEQYPDLTQTADPGSGYLYVQGTNPVLDENDDLTVAGDIDVAGSVTVDTDLDVAGDVDVSGTLTADLTGTADVATVATTVTVANEAADASCFPLFVTAATGDLGAKTNAKLAFNSTSGKLTVDGDVTADSFTLSGLQTAPAAADSTGTAGEVRFGTDGYLYLCTAVDTWIRVQLVTWP